MAKKKNQSGAARNTGNPSIGGGAVPRMTVVKRDFLRLIPSTHVLSQATLSGESQLGVGSYFVNIGEDYALRNFLPGTSGLFTTWDQYRFERLEVLVFLDSPNSAPLSINPVLVTASVDFDDTVAPTWDTMSQRSNTRSIALTAFTPMRSLASWKPVGNYVTSGTDSPSNRVPESSSWWDVANPNQLFNGIKICVASQTATSIRVLVKARVEFRGKI
jgi:hypothetical protein